MDANQKNAQDAKPETAGNTLPLRGAIAGSLLLVAFDGIAVGQGGLALLLATWIVVVRLPLLALAWNKKPLLLYRAKKTAIYLIAVCAVFGWVAFNRDLGDRRAHEIVAAVQAYETRHSRYPTDLDELVPDFLASVPPAKLTFVLDRFEYRLMPGGHHWLTWTVVPPFGRRSYIFEEKRWNYLD